MTKSIILSGLIVAAALAACPVESRARMLYLLPNKRAQYYNWHGNYVYTDYGAPTALVVPPTAAIADELELGAPSLQISRIDHQFTRNWPGAGPFVAGRPFRHTPAWPQSTHQFGVYHVRGPWYPTQP